MPSDLTIRSARAADSAGVLAVWREGLADGEASFLPPSAATPDALASFLPAPRLVALSDGALIGFAFLKAFADSAARAHYSGVAEASIYLRSAHHGRGVGAALLSALIAESEAGGFWTLLAKIFAENQASRALLLRHGFNEVGVLERFGRQEHGRFADQWRDVILYARRSDIAGVD